MITIYYSVKPSLVIRKMGITTKPDPKNDERQTIATNEHFDTIYDPDRGIGFKFLQETLDRSLSEIKFQLKEAKLPLINDDQPLLTTEEWALMSGLDKKVLESHGFETASIEFEKVEWDLTSRGLEKILS